MRCPNCGKECAGPLYCGRRECWERMYADEVELPEWPEPNSSRDRWAGFAVLVGLMIAAALLTGGLWRLWNR